MTTENKFTPGPYTLVDRGNLNGADVCAVVEGWGNNPVRIAHVSPFRSYMEIANLFAAAPDMYAALREAFIVMAGGEGSNVPFDAERWSAAVLGVQAAIAKAEGRNV